MGTRQQVIYQCQFHYRFCRSTNDLYSAVHFTPHPLPLHSPPLHLRLSDTDLHCKPQVSRAGHLKLLYRKVVFKVNIFNLSFSQFRDTLRVHLKHYVVKATGLTFALHIGGWEDP